SLIPLNSTPIRRDRNGTWPGWFSRRCDRSCCRPSNSAIFLGDPRGSGYLTPGLLGLLLTQLPDDLVARPTQEVDHLIEAGAVEILGGGQALVDLLFEDLQPIAGNNRRLAGVLGSKALAQVLAHHALEIGKIVHHCLLDDGVLGQL